MNFSKQISLIRSSRHLHGKWYLETYPDVAALELDPATHYLRYGAAMGRNPGRSFATQFYQETYPEVAESGLNPLVHYVLYGREKGYATCLLPRPQNEALLKVSVVRNKLLSLGITDRSLADLRDIAATSDDSLTRAVAARELALWHMRANTPDGYRTAINYINQARPAAPDIDFRSKLTIIEMMSHYFLDSLESGRSSYDRAALAGDVTPDVLLARVNFEPTPEGRIAWINQALNRYDIAPIAVVPDANRPLYDRLTSGTTLAPVMDGPLVSVLIAVYDAPEMLPTALRSLQEQTWKNLEIIVIDDCSPTPHSCEVVERFAATDPRIRLLRMEKNSGAYVARNHGLDEATGEYVTIHDADDWSHASKIETQVRFMQAHPDVMGCTSEQARCLDDLSFKAPKGFGTYIVLNTSSFLWRRKPVHEAIGYWDGVRFGADNEFIRRMHIAFGKKSSQNLATGPLSFQRDAKTSITGDPIKGLNSGGRYYGVRREYFGAQAHHHKTAANLKYGKDRSHQPFPVPPMMLQPGNAGYQRRFDVVLCEDLRLGNPAVATVCADVEILAAQGKRVGLVEIYTYEAPANPVDPRIRDLLAHGFAEMIVYGDVVEARDIRSAKDSSADDVSRFLPTLIRVE